MHSVARSALHGPFKRPQRSVQLIAGLGVEGDAHQGATVQHRSRQRQDPTAPNLRQVHLLHLELLDELRSAGFDVSPGDLGENVTTLGLDLLQLPRGSRLLIGTEVQLEVTGLRNPCAQLEEIAPGLMQAVLDRAPDGALVRKAGIMGVVVVGGAVHAGDPISVQLPELPHEVLEPI